MSSEVHPLSGRLRAGDTGATYEVLGKLATGGMAELFLARVPPPAGSGEVVVLKRILPHLAEDPEFVRMFRDEADLARRLHHPNIVRSLDAGPPGEHFFTMEYVHGEDLRALVDTAASRGENIPLPHILTIALGITAALHHTHEQTDEHGRPLHIVHRDVSPTNVLIGYDGLIKLVDFGVAKAAAGTHVTRAGTLKGKLAYMSPEQCRADDVDRRSDVFAVGILLYEMTTVTRLFAGDNDIAVLHNVMQGVTTPPSAHRRGYPPALERIVLKALRTDPAQRYPTADALRADLVAFGQQMGLGTDQDALSRYLVSLFGERPLPWDDPAQPGLSVVASPSHPVGDEDRTLLAARVDEQDTTLDFSGSRTPKPTIVGHPGAAVPGPAAAAPVDRTEVAPSRASSPSMEAEPAPSSTPLLEAPRRPPLLALGVVAALCVAGALWGLFALIDGEEAVLASEVPVEAPAPDAPPDPDPDPEPALAPALAPEPRPDPEIQIPPEFTKPPEPLEPKPQFVLAKVEGEGRQREATILLEDGSQVKVALGASVGPYRVVAVNEASVLLERNDGASRVTKRLDL